MMLPIIQESMGGSMADQSSGGGSISINIRPTPPPSPGEDAASGPTPVPPSLGEAATAGGGSSTTSSISKNKLAFRQARRKMFDAGMIGRQFGASHGDADGSAPGAVASPPPDTPTATHRDSSSSFTPVLSASLGGSEDLINVRGSISKPDAAAAATAAGGSGTGAAPAAAPTPPSMQPPPSPPPPPPPPPPSSSPPPAPDAPAPPAPPPVRLMSKSSTFAKIAKLAVANERRLSAETGSGGGGGDGGGGGGEQPRQSPPLQPERPHIAAAAAAGSAAAQMEQGTTPTLRSQVRASFVGGGGGLEAGAAAGVGVGVGARRQSRMMGGHPPSPSTGLGAGAGNVRASFHEAAAAARRTSMAGDPGRRRQSALLGGGAGGVPPGGAAAAAAPSAAAPSATAASSVVKQKFTVTDDIIRQIKSSRRSRHGAGAWSPRAWQRGMGSSRGSIMDTEGLVNAYVELVCEDLKTSEKKRMDTAQEQRSRWIVDPGASWRIRWDLMVLLLVIWTSYSVPFKAAFSAQLSLGEVVADTFIDAIFLLDVMFNCLTAYTEDDGTVQTDPRAILRRYARSWLLVDLISSVPTSFDVGNAHANRLLLGLKFVKLLRLVRFVRYMDSKEVAMFFTPSMLRLVNTLVFLTWVWHVLACIYWYISLRQGLGSSDFVAGIDQRDNPDFLNYVLAFAWTMKTTFAIDPDEGPETAVEAIFTIICFVLGIFMNAYVIGSAGSALQSLDQDKAERRQLLDRIITYMNKRKLPSYFQRIILDFYNYMSEKRSEENVLTGLPPAIQLRLALLLNRELVKNIPLVKQLELNTIVGLMQTLSSTMYMPGEYVFKAGERGDHLYFVKNGRLEVLLLDHAVSQLQKGEMFGQVALTTDGVHEFNVRAAVYSEVLSLNREAYEALAAESEKFMELVEMEAIKQEQFIVKAQKNLKRLAKMVGLATGGGGGKAAPGPKRRGVGDDDEEEQEEDGGGGRGRGAGGGGGSPRPAPRNSLQKAKVMSSVVSMLVASSKKGGGTAKVTPTS